ncbi:MAG: bacterial regulatory s, gntR family protein [Sphingomonas bacterium]|nr:bacterial regulatory s, gntR family protein [Sphingomonas bacterium]
MKSMEPVLPFDLMLGDVRAGGLTRALHRQLRTAIIERRLPPGYRLPSSRRLAEALDIGRNTVIVAYDQLVAAGFARSRRGARLEVSMPEEASRAPVTAPPADRASDTRLAAAWRWPVDRMVYPAGLPARCFRTGVPENRLFDHDIWRRLMSRALRNAARLPFNYGPAQGLPELQDAIAGHAAFVRAVVCRPDDVIVTAGAQQAFDIIARLLVVPGETRVAVENPGFPPLRAAFAGAGARLVPIALDSEGLRIDLIPGNVRVICVTPSHQSPTGVVMSSPRRAALLARAREIGAVVIEDDYDGEFLYDPHPQDALQTLDRDGRVFYVGTFSKSLFPSLRLGFVVAPAWAREAMVDIKRATGSHTHGASQATLAMFIAEGHLARHIRRMRPLYAARRNALEERAAAHWGDLLHVLPGNAGLHLSLSIVDADMAVPIFALAARFLPGALPLSSYAVGDVPPGLCIGYGGVEVDQIAGAVRAMGDAMRPGLRPAPGREWRTQQDSNL